MTISFKNLFYLLLGFQLVTPTVVFACTIASGIGHNGHVWNANNEDGPRGVATFINVFPISGNAKYGYYTLSYYSPKNGEDGGIQGGMNEAGLTFDFNAIQYVEDFDPAVKKAFPEGDAAILPNILATMDSVQQVIAFFDTYWFQNGFRSAQMHVADRHGRFAIISASGSILMEEGQPLVSTNFDICGKEDGSSCWRYPIAKSKLTTSSADFSTMESICRETKNESTLYSNVQNLSTGDIWFYADPQKKPIKINLSELLTKGQKSYPFDDLKSLLEERPEYEWVKPNQVLLPESIINHYTGTYVSYDNLNVAVHEQENSLILTIQGDELSPMFPQSETDFFQESGDFRVKFGIDKTEFKMVMTFYQNEFWSFKATKDLTVEMLEKVVTEEPTSAAAHFAMGVAQHKAGNHKAALASYQRSKELDLDNPQAARNIQWIQESLDMREKPVTVPASVLASYEGQYDVRKVTFRDGKLFYQREGNAESLLIPMSQDMFALEKSETFRLRFVREGNKPAQKVIGIYSDGRTDESERNDFGN